MSAVQRVEERRHGGAARRRPAAGAWIHAGAVTRPSMARSRSSPTPATVPLATLHPRALLAFMREQPASFWLVCLYLFVEYVRPQQIYESLDVVPWGNVVIALAVGALVLERRPLRFEWPDALLATFTAVLVASSIGALRPDVSYQALADWFAWVVIYVLIANSVVTEGRLLMFLLGYVLWNFKMSQSAVRSWAADDFVFRSWGATGAPGWFSNSGEFGIQMCMFLPVVIAFIVSLRGAWNRALRVVAWLIPVTVVVSIVASSSRGALLGLGAATSWMLTTSTRKWRSLGQTILVVALVLLMLPTEQVQRLAEAGEDRTSLSRKLYWSRAIDLMDERPILGIGYRNWQDWHLEEFGVRSLPHNIFLEAGAEMGYAGLLAFAALVAGTLVLNRSTRRIARDAGARGRFQFHVAHALDAALVAYLVSGFFVTVLFYPYFWINFAMTVALHRAAQRHPRLERHSVRPCVRRGHVRVST